MRTSTQLEKYVTMIPPLTTTATTAISGNTITTAVSGGATNGGIDTLGYKRLVAVVQCGILHASATLVVKLMECATDGGTYQDITGAATVSITGDKDGGAMSIEVPLEGRRRFIRAVGTPGTTDSTIWSVLGILKEPITEPVTQNTAAVVVAPTVAAI